MTQYREPMTNADTSFLRMESPDSLMVIPILFIFRDEVKYERMEKLLLERLLQFGRFRQRIVSAPHKSQNPRWERCHDFNIANHLFDISLPQPAGEDELREFINNKISSPLERDKPLWEAYLIKNYGTGSALFFRVHHCLADGFALLIVGASLADLTAEGGAPLISTVTEADSGSDKGGEQVSIIGGLTGALRKAASGFIRLMKNPPQFKKAVKKFYGFQKTLVRLFLRRPDPPTLLKGETGTIKITAWSKPLSLDRIKYLCEIEGCTVNDMLLALTSGAMGRYLESRGERINGTNIRLAVTVNHRKFMENNTLGNQSGMMFPSIPMGMKDFSKRVAFIKERMNRKKGGMESRVVSGLLSAAALSPDGLQNNIMGYLRKKFSGVFTNMVGPPMKLYGAGSLVEGLVSWVVPLGQSVGFNFMSYGGEIIMSIISDKGVIPEPSEIIREFYNELDHVLDIHKPIE